MILFKKKQELKPALVDRNEEKKITARFRVRYCSQVLDINNVITIRCVAKSWVQVYCTKPGHN